MNGSDSLDGLSIAIQGLGKVGIDLAERLSKAGAANNVIYDDAAGEALKEHYNVRA